MVPALGTRTFLGEVVSVVPQADARTRTFPVKIEVVNTISESGPLLKAGMLARVNLPTSTPHMAMLVPKDAQVLGGAAPQICLVRPGDTDGLKASFVTVEAGANVFDYVEIKGACEPGDLVVVRGNERLRPGQPITVVEELPLPAWAAATTPGGAESAQATEQ